MQSKFWRILSAVIFVTVLGGVAVGCSSNLESTEPTPTPTAEPVTVTINLLGNRFDTDAVTIPVGSTLVFHNTTSADHGIICDAFDADLRPGQDFHHTFNSPGVYEIVSRTNPTATNVYLHVTVE